MKKNRASTYYTYIEESEKKKKEKTVYLNVFFTVLNI